MAASFATAGATGAAVLDSVSVESVVSAGGDPEELPPPQKLSISRIRVSLLFFFFLSFRLVDDPDSQAIEPVAMVAIDSSSRLESGGNMALVSDSSPCDVASESLDDDPC